MILELHFFWTGIWSDFEFILLEHGHIISAGNDDSEDSDSRDEEEEEDEMDAIDANQTPNTNSAATIDTSSPDIF